MQKLVVVKNNQVVVSSRQVAEKFGKEHRNVLASIRENLVAENSATKFYQESTHEYRGQRFPEYLMNRDGFTLLAMGFTGKDALQWKIKYITAFNEMEAKLKPLPKQQPLIEEAYNPSLKYYRGIPVVTKKDLAAVLNVVTHRIQQYIVKKGLLIQGRDYYVLTGVELEKFKKDNPGATGITATALTVITASGAKKICKIRNCAESCNELFLVVPPPKPVPVEPVKSIWVKKMVVDAPKNEQVKKAIEKIRKQMTALDVLLTEYYAYNTEALHNGLKETLERVGMNVNHEVFGLTRIKLNIIESKW
ncbi:Rha family transcriptional regulator [uncultured Phascolarctobacterium sp.]|uniref:Rha family transcriptional regulator n=1 Tax=uncultured Phascolarctobacterium sp. TaxID=512296 RepID=UPI0025D86BE3|nr:Rha family transcriptional regulator [uncultured Phascolarctobacterium sp.]